MDTFDVVIVGGGPAGLSAAVWLGRCRRTVLLCDIGEARNARSRGVHGFLTRDGIDAFELRALGRAEAERYGVRFRDVEVVDAEAIPTGWEVVLADGSRARCRKLLLATGLVDRVPDIEGIDTFYGRSVLHCPYCDGWEVQDRAIGVIGSGAGAVGLSLTLKRWSDDVWLFTHGPARLEGKHRKLLAANGIAVRSGRITRLEGTGEQLERVVLHRGAPVARDALFLAYGTRQRCGLAEKLGCRIDGKGAVFTSRQQQVGPAHLFVAGDAARDVHLAIVAAAEGARAAHEINTELTREDQHRPDVA